MLGIGIYYRETTFQQRRYLFELVEQIGNISEACRQAKVSREHYYHWKPRYDKDGIEGLRHPKSHAVHNPKMIDPQIERRIIELKRGHPSWGKKRIAQWIWKEHGWRKIVAVNTVKNVLNRHGLWKNGNKKRKIKNKGVTADKPNKTINIDLCFVPAEEIDAERLNFSIFFDRMDSFCVNLSENGEECTERTGDTGLDIFSREKMSYDERMAAYVLMRSVKGDKQGNSEKKCDLEEIEKKADRKQNEEELRSWRRRIRIERRKEDEEWQKYRDGRRELIQNWKGMSRGKKKELKEEKRRSDEEWRERSVERRELKVKRKKDTTHRATSSKRKKSKPTNRKKTPKPLKGDSNTIEEIEESVDQLQNAEKHGEEQIPTKTKEKRGKKLFTPKKLIATGALIVFILLLLFYVILPTMQGSMHFLIVLSGSMAPEINPGDIVVSTYINPEEIKINDVITFTSAGNPKNCITHRVINITNEYDSIHFQTKGDANEDPDQRIAQSSELIGKVVLVIPYLGYLPHFAKSPLGFITLIIIPGVLIIIGEIWNITRIKKKEPEKKKGRR